MKKIYFVKATLMFIALLGAVVLTSCSKDDEDDPAAPFEYKAPCLKWHCNIDEVRTYMKSLSGFKEDSEVEKKSDGTLSYTFYKSTTTYIYTFSSKGLEECSVDYLFGTADFDKLKASVTSTHGVSDWKQEHTMAGIEWWTTTLKGKKTDITVGKTQDKDGYMYVMFQYTEFDW